MVELTAPSNVYCWTFLRNSAFRDSEQVRKDIMMSLLLGAAALKKEALSQGEDDEPVAIWYAKFEDSYHADPYDKFPHLDEAPPTQEAVHKAWTVLFSFLEDGDEDVFFQPLLEKFDLNIYETLRVEGFREFFSFHATLVCIVSSKKLLVSSDIGEVGKDFIKQINDPTISIEDVQLLLPNQSAPPFPSADNFLSAIKPLELIFDVRYTNLVWETAQNTFFEGINELTGTLQWEDLVTWLDASGVEVSRNKNLEVLGLTTVDLYDTLVIPKIEIKDSLRGGLAAVVLAHEIGHLILHLPILVADAIERLHGSYYTITIKEMYSKCELLEEEADWFAALLLIPPIPAYYLYTGGMPPEREFTFIYSGKGGEAYIETFESRVWEAIRKTIVGKGIDNWPANWSEFSMYENAQLDEAGELIHYDGDTANVIKMVVRLVKMVTQRREMTPDPKNSHDKLRHKLYYHPFDIIVDYLGRFEI